MKNKIDPCDGFNVVAGGGNCGTNDIHDACNTYTCVDNGDTTASCSTATRVADDDPCDDGIDNTVDACQSGSCVSTGEKIFFVFRIKHLNW